MPVCPYTRPPSRIAVRIFMISDISGVPSAFVDVSHVCINLDNKC